MSTYAAVPTSSTPAPRNFSSTPQQSTLRISRNGTLPREQLLPQLRKLRPGFVFVGLAAVNSAFAGLGAKLLSVPPHATPVYALVFWRSVFIFAVSASVSKFYLKNSNVLLGPPAARHLIFARSIVGVVAITLFYLSVQSLNLGEAVVLSFLSPVFVGILGRIFLGEPWKLTEAISCFVSLLGVTVMARPNLFGLGKERILPEPLDGDNSSPQRISQRILEKQKEAASAIIYLPLSRQGEQIPYFTAVVCSILSAFFASCVVIILRRLRGVNALHILVVFSWVASLFSLVMSLVSGDGITSVIDSAPRDAYGFFTLFGCLSLATLGSQYFFVIAVRYENAATCSTLSFIQVPLAFVLEFLLRGVAPKLTDALGGILIFCSVLCLGIAHVRRDRRERLLRAAANSQSTVHNTSAQSTAATRPDGINEELGASSSISLTSSAKSDSGSKMNESSGKPMVLRSSLLEVEYDHDHSNDITAFSRSRMVALADSDDDLVPSSVENKK